MPAKNARRSGPRPVQLTPAVKQLVVEVWDHEYVALRPTKSASRRYQAALQALADAQDQSDEQTLPLLCELFDAQLEPVNGAPPVSELVQERWEKDETDSPELEAILERLEKARAKVRPT